MFNIGPMELILILVIVLIVFGPGKLPEVARGLGKAVREFRKASAGVQRMWDDVSQESEEETVTKNTAPTSRESANSVAPKVDGVEENESLQPDEEKQEQEQEKEDRLS